MLAAGTLQTTAMGVPQADDAPPAGLSLLDERDEWLAFSRQAAEAGAAAIPDGCWESSVALEGMHCAACAGTIERLIGAVPGVREVQVSAAAQRARVLWDERATRPSRWLAALQGSGYRAVPVHDLQAAVQRQADTRRMLWRLGVAGLCMMQVMMYAAPSYFTAPGEIEPDLIHLLRWAQWVLSLPVLLFSCQPFLVGAWRDARARRIGMDLPVALGMLITFVVSSLGTFEPAGPFGHEVYFDSFTMFVFFLLAGRWLELRLRDRAAGALEALMHRLPDSVQRRDAGGGWQRVSARRVRVGDVLRVLPGEGFVADGTILSGRTTVDEALLTGESRPVARSRGETVIAGSHNLSQPVELRVSQVGEGTRYAQVVALMEQAAVSKPRIAQLADRLATPFLVFVLLAAGVACAWWWPQDPERALMVAVAILVVTCPCALSLLDRVNVRAGVPREEALALAAALARHSLHPVSRAVAAAAGEAAPPEATRVHETVGQGVAGDVAWGGLPRRLRLGSHAFCAVPAAAAAGPVSHLSDEQGWLASFYFLEDIRADAQASVAALHEQGLQVQLVSGDDARTAAQVGGQLGVDAALGGCSPADKLAHLRALQEQGARTAMVGDGLNDGPVLAAAQASFAFGRAVPLAQAQSDFVVLGERLLAVPAARRQAVRTVAVVKQNLSWAMVYNAAAVPMAMAGWMPAWAAGLGMATSSLVVVLNALRLSRGMDGGWA